MRMLRRLVEGRRDLVQDRVRLTNRITHLLKEYFPQVLQWFRDKETAVFADFVERWPALVAAQRARRDTLVAFFHSHNVRKQPVIDRRIEAIRSRALSDLRRSRHRAFAIDGSRPRCLSFAFCAQP